MITRWSGVTSCRRSTGDWGTYVGRPRFDRAFSLVTGFDLARGRGELAEFQRWMSERHPGSSSAFWALILVEAFGDQADEDCLVSDEDHQRAIGSLCLRLREFLDSRASQVEELP